VPDYTPLYLPGLTATFTALGSITGGDPLEVAGTMMVQKCRPGPSGLGSAKYIGIATQDVISGNLTTVVLDRVVHQGTADGAVTAGDLLMASSKTGCQVKTAPVTSSLVPPVTADVDQVRVIIGVALTTAPDGTLLTWMQK
jgi:hypothetical protein